MRKLIYYHRHGETVYSLRGTGYGDKEYEAVLTKKGRSEVHLLGAELGKRGPFDLYFTSPLPRAVQTATIVQSYLNDIDVQVEPALIEGFKEKREEIWDRVAKLAERLVKLPEQKILLSAHGFICVALAEYFRGKTVKNMNLENLPTAAFGWIELEDGVAKRGCRYSTVHLNPAKAVESVTDFEQTVACAV
jgi:broad specificity phosphatase PhoE